MHRHLRVPVAALTIATGLTASGCVVWRIEDQLDEINATTARTSEILATTSESLTLANQTLAHLQTQLDQVQRTNALLLQLQAGLGTEELHAIEGHPDAAPQRRSIMTTLNSIDGSLGKLDNHLASLRRTLENIDSTIPFIGFADPAKDEPALDADGNPIVDPDAPPADPNAPIDPNSAVPPSPEPAPDAPPPAPNPEAGAPPADPATPPAEPE